MELERTLALAQDSADKSGIQVVVVNDPIANSEDESGPFGFMPTMAIPIFIVTLQYATIEKVIEPKVSSIERRQDLETAVLKRFRENPQSLKS